MSGSPYGFYAATLRFAAARIGADDARIEAMAALLRGAADDLDATGSVTIAAADLEAAARAFAGIAAFLQKDILPETVAHGHDTAERQVRWTVDAAMAAVNALLQAAAGERRPVTLALPPPP